MPIPCHHCKEDLPYGVEVEAWDVKELVFDDDERVVKTYEVTRYAHNECADAARAKAGAP